MKKKPTYRLHIALITILGSALLNYPAAAPSVAHADKAEQKSKAQPAFSVRVSGQGAPMILIPGLTSSGDT
jgi:hypothetical protein